VSGSVFDVPTTMSKMLYLEMSFEDILLSVTANPVRFVNRIPGMGTLEDQRAGRHRAVRNQRRQFSAHRFPKERAVRLQGNRKP
jgi:predicted amidohydrolase